MKNASFLGHRRSRVAYSIVNMTTVIKSTTDMISTTTGNSGSSPSTTWNWSNVERTNVPVETRTTKRENSAYPCAAELVQGFSRKFQTRVLKHF